jgi:hypothetical protein
VFGIIAARSSRPAVTLDRLADDLHSRNGLRPPAAIETTDVPEGHAADMDAQQERERGLGRLVGVAFPSIGLWALLLLVPSSEFDRQYLRRRRARIAQSSNAART